MLQHQTWFSIHLCFKTVLNQMSHSLQSCFFLFENHKSINTLSFYHPVFACLSFFLSRTMFVKLISKSYSYIECEKQDNIFQHSLMTTIRTFGNLLCYIPQSLDLMPKIELLLNLQEIAKPLSTSKTSSQKWILWNMIP